MKIKIKLNNTKLLNIVEKGDWIDLYAAENIDIKKGQFAKINLGVAMELPKGYEAIIAPRSSTFKYYSITMANSIGIIDNTYCGNNDYWSFAAIAHNNVSIKAGNKICQFRIQLSQKATFWQKLRWLFDSKIKFKEVDVLNKPDRGGFGTTGK